MQCAFSLVRKSLVILFAVLFSVTAVAQTEATKSAPSAKKPAAKTTSKKSTATPAAKKPSNSTKKKTTTTGASKATTSKTKSTAKSKTATPATKTQAKPKSAEKSKTAAPASKTQTKSTSSTKSTKSTSSTKSTKSKTKSSTKKAAPKAKSAPKPEPEATPEPEPEPEPAPPVETPAKAGEVRDYSGISFVKIDPGTFQMGSAGTHEDLAKTFGGEPAQYADEVPSHAVTLTKGFWMGRYEITNAQFEVFVAAASYQTDAEREGTGRVWDGDKWVDKPGANWRSPGWTTEPTQPVTLVSWNDAQAYLEWLNKQGAGHFRLPSEAEWEYCCRAGTVSAFSFGDAAKDLPDFACCRDNSGADVGGKPFAVGARKPNAWGLYDMHGNLLEWCQDGYDPAVYGAGSAQDPQGPDKAGYRVMRGGSWFSLPQYCRCASRTRSVANYRFFLLGFRICRDE